MGSGNDVAGRVVFGGKAPLRIGRRLWQHMVAEFERNGRRTLTAGKVRYLRRISRRLRLGEAWISVEKEREAWARLLTK